MKIKFRLVLHKACDKCKHKTCIIYNDIGIEREVYICWANGDADNIDSLCKKYTPINKYRKLI